MTHTPVTVEDIRQSIGKTMNWKVPGIDGLHNFWWKKITLSHSHLAKHFNHMIEHPETTPDFFTTGIAFLLYKSGDPNAPQNYLPITCLPTVYKLFTTTVTNRINTLTENGILTQEQKGCIKNSYGCKEQLVVNSFVLKQVQRNSRYLSIAYIDYQKAFDSVPLLWLVEVLKIYKINLLLIKCLTTLMSSWKTKLVCQNITTKEIPIRLGIYQGDSLSPVWFCLSLNPLPKLLNSSQYGYKLNQRTNVMLTHLLYMDDLKLFASTPEKLYSLISLVQKFSKDINMTFGMSKCAIIRINRGKFKCGTHYQLKQNDFIRCLEENQTYKYLGIQQNYRVNQTHLTVQFRNKYIDRLKLVLKTKLNAKNKTIAINSWATLF
jgi:hypothetical protein